jgi:hypothetical protein
MNIPKKADMTLKHQTKRKEKSIPLKDIEIDTIMKLSINHHHSYIINAGRLPRLTKLKQLMKAYCNKNTDIPPILVYEQKLYTMPHLRQQGLCCVKYKIKDGRHRVAACINLNRNVINAEIVNSVRN